MNPFLHLNSRRCRDVSIKTNSLCFGIEFWLAQKFKGREEVDSFSSDDGFRRASLHADGSHSGFETACLGCKSGVQVIIFHENMYTSGSSSRVFNFIEASHAKEEVVLLVNVGNIAGAPYPSPIWRNCQEIRFLSGIIHSRLSYKIWGKFVEISKSERCKKVCVNLVDFISSFQISLLLNLFSNEFLVFTCKIRRR